MARRTESFRPDSRLRKRADFLRARNASKVNTAHFLILVAPGASAKTRIGLTVSRKVGNAVVRNRIKRLIRELFRRHRASLPPPPPPKDIVVVARPSAGMLESRALRAELLLAFAKIGF